VVVQVDKSGSAFISVTTCGVRSENTSSSVIRPLATYIILREKNNCVIWIWIHVTSEVKSRGRRNERYRIL